MEDSKIKIIENYIEAYNAFNIEGMVANLNENVVFENITNEESDLTTHGIEEFKIQAEKAKHYFSSRTQKIESWNIKGDIVTIDIQYEGILAIDLPNGAKVGDTLALTGQSEFVFSNGKIMSIQDRS